MSRTWTICTEGRLLDHCATLPSRTLRGKIIIFLKSIFPWNSAGRSCLKLVGLYLSWIQKKINKRKIRHKCCCCCCCCWLAALLFLSSFFLVLCGIFIARHHQHLFVTGLVKNTLTSVTWSELHSRSSYSELLSKWLGMMIEIEFIHLLRRKCLTPFCLFILLHGALAKNACASHTR